MPVFSHSKLSAFELCPAKYKFAYVEKVQTGKEFVEPFMGRRVHESLRFLYSRLASGSVPPIDEVLLNYDGNWEGKFHSNVEVVREGEFDASYYRGEGVKCIENYYFSHHPFDAEGGVVGLEKPFFMRLGGDYSIRGVIDRISLLDGTLEVHDYKTTQEMPSREEILSSRQLGFYQMGVQAANPSAQSVESIFHFLRFGKSVRSSRSKAELDVLSFETMRLIRKIEEAERANDFPASPSELCHWCEFKGMCPAYSKGKDEFPIALKNGGKARNAKPGDF